MATQLLALPRGADTVGQRIAQARRFRQLRQDDLEPIIKTSRETISSWENSRTSPTTDNLIAVAKALEFPVAWFVDGLDEQTGPAGPTDDGGAECAPWDLNPEPAGYADVLLLPIAA